MSLSLDYLRENIHKIPYQKTSDTPTIKMYTNWREYEKYVFSEDLIERWPPGTRVPGEIERLFDMFYIGPVLTMRRPLDDVETTVMSRRDVLEKVSREGVDTLFRSINPLESRVLARHLVEIGSVANIKIAEGSKRSLAVYVGGSTERLHLSQHIILTVGQDAEVSVLLYVDRPIESMRSLVAEVFLERGSRAKIGFIGLGGSASYYQNISVLYNSSSLDLYTLVIGGTATSVRNRSLLIGEGSSYTGTGLSVSRGGEWVYYLESSILSNRETRSRIDIRGVSMEGSRNIVQGHARQEPSAQRSGASVSVHGVNLGTESLLVTSPLMEVLTGDVEEASHASSQYTLDIDTETYLRSRGLGKREIIEIVIRDYIEDFLSYVDDRFREFFRDIIAREVVIETLVNQRL